MKSDPRDTFRSLPIPDVPIEVTVSVGHARPTVRELLELGNNSVLQLDRSIEEPVELLVGDKLIARGELEESDETEGLAVRITEVVTVDSKV